MQNMPSRPQSLHEYLNDQLAFLDATPEQLLMVRYLISHINENGLITTPLEELVRNYQPPVALPQMEEALALLQKLDPPGIGARNLEECLLLQLTPETPYRDVLRPLIQHHLEDIHHNRLPIIQRRIVKTPGCSTTRGASSVGTTNVASPSRCATSIVSRSSGIASYPVSHGRSAPTDSSSTSMLLAAIASRTRASRSAYAAVDAVMPTRYGARPRVARRVPHFSRDSSTG